MTNPVYKCPHCKKGVEIELTKTGNLVLNGYPSPKSLPSQKSIREA